MKNELSKFITEIKQEMKTSKIVKNYVYFWITSSILVFILGMYLFFSFLVIAKASFWLSLGLTLLFSMIIIFKIWLSMSFVVRKFKLNSLRNFIIGDTKWLKRSMIYEAIIISLTIPIAIFIMYIILGGIGVFFIILFLLIEIAKFICFVKRYKEIKTK